MAKSRRPPYFLAGSPWPLVYRASCYQLHAAALPIGQWQDYRRHLAAEYFNAYIDYFHADMLDIIQLYEPAAFSQISLPASFLCFAGRGGHHADHYRFLLGIEP